MNRKEKQEVRRKLKILDHAKKPETLARPVATGEYPEIRFIVGKKIMQLKEKQG